MNLAPARSTETRWFPILKLFRDDQERPWLDNLTPTQIHIISLIAGRRSSRSQLILPTQYGKSLAVAFGVLLRIAFFKESWAIVAPTGDKAQIIMDYVISHIFDSPMFSERIEGYDSKEKLMQHRSKQRITFKDAGELRVFTANATNTTATRQALMGFGAPNIILDESSLIGDDLYSTVHRMLGGTKDNFLLEIGNPFYRNHFYKASSNPRYHHILVDCYQALAEGRYTQEFIDEAREQAFFDVLYECKFPVEQEVLPNGYRKLLKNQQIDSAIERETEMPKQGKPILGIDVAGGGKNETKYVIRWNDYAKVVATYAGDDLEAAADIAEQIIRDYSITDYRCAIDAGGVGHGLPAIMKKRGHLVKPVMFGESAPDKAYLNMRAFMYWELRKWIIEGGRMFDDLGFQEVKNVYYRQTPNGKLTIEPKEEMIKRLAEEGIKVESPDTADALVLTFVDTSKIVEDDDFII